MVEGGERCLENGGKHAKNLGVQEWAAGRYGERATAMAFPRRSRLFYASAVILVMGSGLFTRSRRMPRPSLVAEFGGDTLWALLVFLLVGFLFPGLSTARAALVAGVIAAAVEFGQMVHAPWLEALRGTLCGRLVLGRGFLWSDLVCYGVGIAIGVVAELVLRGRRRR